MIWNTPGPDRCAVCWKKGCRNHPLGSGIWVPMCDSCRVKGIPKEEVIQRLRDNTMLDEIAGCVDG